MFTGIIRNLGKVKKIVTEKGATHLTISSPVATSLSEGDSLAVNGTCLTVLDKSKQSVTFRLMQATLKNTNLGQLKVKGIVNLELPLTPTQSIDGHFVMGHIDGLAQVTHIKPVKHDRIFTFQPPADLLPYLVSKGSVALDGVSLTVVDISSDTFTVSMMPYTLEHTLFGQVKEGYQANIEVDILGKYVTRLTQQKAPLASNEQYVPKEGCV